MRIYIILFFLVPILFSCKSSTPPEILDKDQMADVLVDVHLVNGTLATVPQLPDSLYKYGINKYQVVFKNHHTDSTQFRKSFKYYVSKPDQLDAVYEQVVEKLKKKTESFTKKSTSPKNAVPAK
ncbi:DUF4296 domain-containing protein [Mucilaginibacter lacusdianchii]|uniref:DUF4296 domain-containing protein n=1 Tax=Mucilaginibacter lacusdianchii TaxID=2684211 RepID=UPI00131CFC63|nr:DUF4296 domain-containing protein [Mucilaginibacter sp. JXJ CY 39]